jgi:hypothetical protein
MGTIQNISQIRREWISECSELIKKMYIDSIRPIYCDHEYQKIEHLGSCVLIELKNIKFILTAAHVLDYNTKSQTPRNLFVSNHEKLIPIIGDCLSTKLNEGVRDNDKLDFAVIIIPDSMINDFKNLKFIKLDDLKDTKPHKPDNIVTALGYPNSKNKNYKVSKLFNFSSRVETSDTTYSALMCSKYTHILFGYDLKSSKNSEGRNVNALKPNGMSGGGLFHLGDFSKPETFKTPYNCNGSFEGVLIEIPTKSNIFITVRIGTIIKSIEQSYNF